MSSYLSQPVNYSPIVSNVNLPLVAKVLEVKQGAYNKNYAQIQSTLDQFGATNLLRDQDKEYLSNKLTEVTNQINSSGNRDLSKNSVATDFTSKLKTIAADPIVLNAIENTQKFQNFNSSVEKLKEKKPELYSETNYGYALDQAGFSEYMKGNTNKLQNLSYTNFTDAQKELKDISENLDKYADVIKQTRPDGSEYFITREGKSLSEDKLYNITSSLLTDGAKKQLQIDGWATYDQGNTPEEKLNRVTTAFTNYRDEALKTVNDNIDKYTTLLKNEPENTEYKQSLEAFKNQKSTQSKQFDDVIASGNKSAMYTTMYTNRTIGNFSKIFAFDNVFESQSVNSNYWNRVNYEYKVNKDALDRADKKQTDSAGIQTKITPQEFPQGQADLYDKQQQYVAGLDQKLESETQNIYDTLDPTTRKVIDDEVQKNGGTRADALITLGKNSSNIVSVEQAKRLDDLRLLQTTEKDKFNTLVKEATDATKQVLDSDALVQRLYSNPNIKIAWTGSDGRERLFPASEVLKVNGIVDTNGKKVRSLKETPKLMTALQNSIYADKAVSNPGNTEYIRNLAQSLGENYAEIAIQQVPSRNYGGYAGVSNFTTNTLNPNSKTAKYLELHRKQGGFNRAGILSADDSFDDIPEVDSFINSSAQIRKDVGEKLAQDETLAINKTVLIPPKTKAFTDLSTFVGDKFDVADSNSLVINMIPNQPNMVRISQLKESTSKGQIIDNTRIADERIEDLPQSLRNQIDLQNKKATLNTKNIPNIESNVKYGSFNDNRRILDLANNVLAGDIRAAESTTKEGALDLMFKNPQFSKVTGSLDAPTQTGIIIRSVIEDPNIVVKLNKTPYGVFPQIIRKIGDDETLIYEDRTPINDTNIQSVYDKIRFTPQLYVNSLLQSVLAEKSTPNSTNFVLNKLTQIYGQ